MEVRALVGNLQTASALNSNPPYAKSPQKQTLNQSIQDISSTRFTQFDNEQLSMTLNNAKTMIKNGNSNDYMNIQIESSASKTQTHYNNNISQFPNNYNDTSGLNQNVQLLEQNNGLRNSTNGGSPLQVMQNQRAKASYGGETTTNKQMNDSTIEDDTQLQYLNAVAHNHMYQTSYDSKVHNQDSSSIVQQRCRFIQDNQQNNIISIDNTKQNRQVYASTYRVNRSKLQYQQNHKLYQTKAQKMNNKSQNPYQRQPNHFLNYINSNSQNLTDMSIDKDIHHQQQQQQQISLELRDSIKISRIAQHQQINNGVEGGSSVIKLGKYKTDKSVNNRSHINSDINYINNNSQDPSMNQMLLVSADAGQGMNTIQLMQGSGEKYIDLNISDVDILNASHHEKNNSNQTDGNQGQSDLQSPHSAQEHNNYMLRPKGLVVLADSKHISHRTNQHHNASNRIQTALLDISKSQESNKSYLIESMHYQEQIRQQALQIINTQDLKPSISDPSERNEDILLITSKSLIDNSNNDLLPMTQRLNNNPDMMITDSKVQKLHNQSLNQSNFKQQVSVTQQKLSQKGNRRRSQSNIAADLSNLLDVVPLVTDHNNLKSQALQQQNQQQQQLHQQARQNRTVLVQNKSLKQSVQLTKQDMRNLNPDFLQIIVEHRNQPYPDKIIVTQANNEQPVSQMLNQDIPELTVIQSIENINSNASNFMSSINNQLLSVPQNMQTKTQQQASISHTPPNWDAVYQHNSSSIADPKEGSRLTIENGNLKEFQRSQKLLENNQAERVMGNSGKNQKMIASEKKINERAHSGLDQIDVKTLKLDNRQSQDTNNIYQQLQQINMLDTKIYSDQSPPQLPLTHVNRIFNNQINSNVVQSGDQRELIFSVQRSDYQGNSLKDLNQASMRELCVGTDELENLMNEDQLSSHMSSALNVQQLMQNLQNNGQIYIEKGGANIQDMFNQNMSMVSSQPFTFVNLDQNQQPLYQSPLKDNKLLNSSRITIENNSRVIVKNIMGKNKVLYVQGNGKSIDIDAVKEIKCDKLRISGDRIQPLLSNKLNMTNSIFSASIMDPKFNNNRDFKDANISGQQSLQKGSIYGMESSVRYNKQNEDISQIIQEFENTGKMESIRTYNPYDLEVQNSAKTNPFNPSSQVQVDQKGTTQNNISTPITELMRYSQNRNQSQISQITRNVVPTVLITSSNFKNVKQMINSKDSNEKMKRDNSLRDYDDPQFSNQKLKSAPRLESRTKTASGHRVVLYTQNNQSKDEKDAINTLRAPSKDYDSPKVWTNKNTSQNKTMNQTYENFNVAQQNSQSKPKQQQQQLNKKGLIYKISQEFSEAMQKTNKLASLTREQQPKQQSKVEVVKNGVIHLKSQDQHTLKDIFAQQNSRSHMTQENFYNRKGKSLNKEIRSTKPQYSLINIQDDSIDGTYQKSRNIEEIEKHNTDQSLYLDKHQSQRMRSTAGTINGFNLSSKNQSHINALEKKIFRRERVLNNADRSLIEMKGYPFIIPNQNSTVYNDPYNDRNSRTFIQSTSDFYNNQQHSINHYSLSQNSRQIMPEIPTSSLSKDLQRHYGGSPVKMQTFYKHDNSSLINDGVQHILPNSALASIQTRSNTMYPSFKKPIRKTVQHHMSMIQKGSTVAQLNQLEQEQMLLLTQKEHQENKQNDNSSFNQYKHSNTVNVPSSIQKKARRNLTSIIQQNRQKSDGIRLI